MITAQTLMYPGDGASFRRSAGSDPVICPDGVRAFTDRPARPGDIVVMEMAPEPFDGAVILHHTVEGSFTEQQIYGVNGRASRCRNGMFAVSLHRLVEDRISAMGGTAYMRIRRA